MPKSLVQTIRLISTSLKRLASKMLVLRKHVFCCIIQWEKNSMWKIRTARNNNGLTLESIQHLSQQSTKQYGFFSEGKSSLNEKKWMTFFLKETKLNRKKIKKHWRNNIFDISVELDWGFRHDRVRHSAFCTLRNWGFLCWMLISYWPYLNWNLNPVKNI